MKAKFPFILLILAISLICLSPQPAKCERTNYLALCQELVSNARTYEARASHHNRVAKSYQMQIENMAKQPKNQATISAMDTLFSQYDENRVLESKFMELYKQSAEEAKKCMKAVD